MKRYMRFQLKVVARGLGIVYILLVPAARAQSPRPSWPKGTLMGLFGGGCSFRRARPSVKTDAVVLMSELA